MFIHEIDVNTDQLVINIKKNIFLKDDPEKYILLLLYLKNLGSVIL